MKAMKLTILAILSTGLLGLLAIGKTDHSGSIEPATSLAQKYRAIGPEGLDKFLEDYGDSMTVSTTNYFQVLDQVAGQKDAKYSRLFWYKDPQLALEKARAENKPVLYLRMLGKLTDERSCANSRLFRSILYPDPEVSSFLKEHFVLVWESERPVPQVSIDFGDGRKIETTLAGNSIHYVLDTAGKPIDALPGLYSPQKFLSELEKSHAFFKELAQSKPEESPGKIQKYHQRKKASIQSTAGRYAGIVGMQETDSIRSIQFAESLTIGKAAVEVPLVERLVLLPGTTLETNPALLDRIAERMGISCMISQEARDLIRSKNTSRFADQEELDKQIQQLEESTKRESVLNEVRIRPNIYDQFIKQPIQNLDDLNSYVYSSLFATPAEDKWLGLLPDGVYTGLPNDGVMVE